MAENDLTELERLRQELKEVTAERNRLLAENRFLIQASKGGQKLIHAGVKDSVIPHLQTDISEDISRSSVNNESPLSDKMHLYRSLFHGREDVYAKFWQSRQSLKTGYSPVCIHEWDRIFCKKPEIRCSNCPNRELAPLTDNVIENHLEGKITVGVYPLLEDDSCYFLAVDFDKHTWIEDCAAFLETCQITGIPAAIERSRSGNGGHVWIFFSEAVPASAARNLGCYLLTQAMSRRYQLGMDSYDRLFPNQDTVPKGGFGNLIALPFQKGPSEKGNSLFVDIDFKPFQDQWSFLASLERVKRSILDEVVNEAVRTGQIIGIHLISTDDEEQPWTTTPSRQMRETLPAGPWPGRVEIVLGNLIYIKKSGLTAPLLNRIKRLAAFQNPEYYKRQKMRLSTALTPRVICCAEEFPQHLGIPRGCLDELLGLLKSINIKPELSDKHFRGSDLKTTFHGQLTPVQQAAVKELLQHDNGILVAPSGSGKTVVGISIIASRGVNTLVLVHRSPLLEQWRTQLASFLEIESIKIGQIGGGKDRRSGLIDVAMLQSLVKKGQVNEIVGEYGQVIIDECHHLPAFTFEQVLRQVKARYVVGLTATPYRRDGHQPIILMQCGQVRYEIRLKDQKSQILVQHNLVCRNTNFALPPSESEISIHDIYAALVADGKRNKLILDDILKSLDEGRSPILLTERREHLEFFASQLKKTMQNVVVLRGGMGNKQRQAVREQLASIPEDEKRILLATGRYIGEGFDDARLDTLFLVLPVSWKGTLLQYAGRLHRIHSGKTEVRIYDYVDHNIPTLMRMFQRRLRGYRAMGYNLNDSNIKPGEAETSTPTLWDSLTLT